ncbi:hypothetical protein [Pseudoalteromonas piscicida]|nr:hypothetical protein [Pseudoalteromonas piscicida]
MLVAMAIADAYGAELRRSLTDIIRMSVDFGGDTDSFAAISYPITSFLSR